MKKEREDLIVIADVLLDVARLTQKIPDWANVYGVRGEYILERLGSLQTIEQVKAFALKSTHPLKCYLKFCKTIDTATPAGYLPFVEAVKKSLKKENDYQLSIFIAGELSHLITKIIPKAKSFIYGKDKNNYFVYDCNCKPYKLSAINIARFGMFFDARERAQKGIEVLKRENGEHEFFEVDKSAISDFFRKK